MNRKKTVFICLLILVCVVSLFFAVILLAVSEPSGQENTTEMTTTAQQAASEEPTSETTEEITTESTEESNNTDDISLEEFKSLDFAALYEKGGDLIVAGYEGKWNREDVDSQNSGVIRIGVEEDFGINFEGVFLHCNPNTDPPAPFTGHYCGKAVFVTENIAIGKLDMEYTNNEDIYVGFFWDGDSMYVIQKDQFIYCMGNGVTSEGTYTLE
ncbi:MAG: hypothetical protein IKS48_14000 [Eubacterium sp.]|nr:hypothetical protein [Eubacterium sp.]